MLLNTCIRVCVCVVCLNIFYPDLKPNGAVSNQPDPRCCSKHVDRRIERIEKIRAQPQGRDRFLREVVPVAARTQGALPVSRR
jgi:hypothetical protein